MTFFLHLSKTIHIKKVKIIILTQRLLYHLHLKGRIKYNNYET